MNASSARGGPAAQLGPPQLALAGVAAFVFYAALGQHTFYREDGFQIVYHFLMKGNVAHDIHPLYLPAAAAFTRILAWTGLGVFRLASLFSALSAALGLVLVGLLARRARVGCGRSWLLIGLVGLCPPVVFFATVVEFHAFFFLFACLVFLVAEGFMADRGGPWAPRRLVLPLVLGLATALATLAHSTGSLLVPLTCAWVAARVGLRSRLADLSVFAGCHVVLLFGLRQILLRGLGLDAATANDPGRWLAEWFHGEGLLERAAPVLLHEVLLPYLPLSLVFLLPVFVATPRRRIGWSLLGLVPYYALSVAVLADRRTGAPIREHGSYLLPLAIPAAWAFVRAVPRRGLLVGLAAVALAASVLQVRVHDVRPGRTYGAGLRAALDGRPTYVLAGTRDMGWIVVEAPAVHPFYLAETLAEPEAQLRAWLPATIDPILAAGGRVLLSAAALADLEHPKAGPRGRAVLDLLRSRYRLVPLASGAFHGFDVGHLR